MVTISTYTIPDKAITISGFVAFLLHQGQEWDMRCVEADMHDYQQLYYARMDAREALLQELHWWIDFAMDPRLEDIPYFADLRAEGFVYLFGQAREVICPMSDSEKLETGMAIYLDEYQYLYKQQDALALFQKNGEIDLESVISGFPAQLLTYAACTTIDIMLDEQRINDMAEWADMIIRWLQSPSVIMLRHIRFDITDVYTLYATYVAEAKADWDAQNLKRYQSGKPQVRYFMTHLLEQLQEEAQNAIDLLTPYLTEKQQTAFTRYLWECQQYIADHTKTRRQPPRNTMDSYWGEEANTYWRGEAVKRLKAAVQAKHPAAALALEVKKLQAKNILKRSILPYSAFVLAIKTITGVDINPDTLSKHFRR